MHKLQRKEKYIDIEKAVIKDISLYISIFKQLKNMKDNGSMINKMDMVQKCGQMDHLFKDSFKTVLNKEKINLYIIILTLLLSIQHKYMNDQIEIKMAEVFILLINFLKHCLKLPFFLSYYLQTTVKQTSSFDRWKLEQVIYNTQIYMLIFWKIFYDICLQEIRTNIYSSPNFNFFNRLRNYKGICIGIDKQFKALDITNKFDITSQNLEIMILQIVYSQLECYIMNIYSPYQQYFKEINQKLQDISMKLIRQQPHDFIIIQGNINKSKFSLQVFTDTAGRTYIEKKSSLNLENNKNR